MYFAKLISHLECNISFLYVEILNILRWKMAIVILNLLLFHIDNVCDMFLVT